MRRCILGRWRAVALGRDDHVPRGHGALEARVDLAESTPPAVQSITSVARGCVTPRASTTSARPRTSFAGCSRAQAGSNIAPGSSPSRPVAPNRDPTVRGPRARARRRRTPRLRDLRLARPRCTAERAKAIVPPRCEVAVDALASRDADRPRRPCRPSHAASRAPRRRPCRRSSDPRSTAGTARCTSRRCGPTRRTRRSPSRARRYAAAGSRFEQVLGRPQPGQPAADDRDVDIARPPRVAREAPGRRVPTGRGRRPEARAAIGGGCAVGRLAGSAIRAGSRPRSAPSAGSARSRRTPARRS